MADTPTTSSSMSLPSPSTPTSDESESGEKSKCGMHSMHPIDTDIDLTIRPARVPSPKAPKRRIISNTVTSCLSKFDSPDEVVWVTMGGSRGESLILHKADGKLSMDDLIDAYTFFKIINDPQTTNYKDVLPFILTRRTEFFRQRLCTLSAALEAMKEVWSALDISPSVDEEFPSSSSPVHARYPGLTPVNVLTHLASEIRAHVCVRMDGVRVEQLVSKFHLMLESCHLLLRSRAISKAPSRSRAAALKSALERLLPLSGGVDYLIKYSRDSFPGRGIRWSVARGLTYQ